MPPERFVVVSGGIAVGKTTVISALAEAKPGVTVLHEARGEYVDAFYRDPARLAYENQLAYMQQFMDRAKQVMALDDDTIVQERSVHDTHHVFSALFRAQGLLTEVEFAHLHSLYRKTARRPRPTLLVLLDAEAHISRTRMRARGIPAETATVSLVYLQSLREQHLRWFARYRLSRKVRVRTDRRTVEDVVTELVGFL